MRIVFFLIALLILTSAEGVYANTTHKHASTKHSATKHAHSARRPTHHASASTHKAPPLSITPDDLVGFDDYPRDVKKLITDALALADQHLPYRFGSTDPSVGLDCSGAISYLLKESEVDDVPRQADQIYQWAWENGQFSAVNSKRISSFEFAKLKPGDLLFWSGTYPVQRDTDVTHVMMYIGRDKDNRPLMFGATSNRVYQGKPDGVGVFSFNMPSGRTKARFLGYACVPHLNC
ncbi:MAG TPA: NlpC/P60 family protein [Gammaproteobacteria bacterium]|jgi:cell wall-associated NlpC family hydrolase|nr:NlpC/P60 family protein [Gammaproteobacteria bacterium]